MVALLCRGNRDRFKRAGHISVNRMALHDDAPERFRCSRDARKSIFTILVWTDAK
jgi:hypothetical protein